MKRELYHIGGYLPDAPNGNRAEEYDLDAGTFTRWDADGGVLEQRALAADETAALTPPANPQADAFDALADEAEQSALADVRALAPLYRAAADALRGQ
jgi:hypothetical protein